MAVLSVTNESGSQQCNSSSRPRQQRSVEHRHTSENEGRLLDPHVSSTAKHRSNRGPSVRARSCKASSTGTMQDGEENLLYENIQRSLPTESELLLLCLDHLRDLRRTYPPHLLSRQENIQADYVTMACWALNRAFTADRLTHYGNDCFRDNNIVADAMNSEPREAGSFPSVQDMEEEILVAEDRHNATPAGTFANPEDVSLRYDYDDNHVSNALRFYPVAGLANGMECDGPYSLGELVAAGSVGLGARTRQTAERGMIQSPLFEQFADAVQQKGFFDDPDNDTPSHNESSAEHAARIARKQAVYGERHRKVVTKFRNKLAHTSDDKTTSGDFLAIAAAEQWRQSRIVSIQEAIMNADEEEPTELTSVVVSTDESASAFLKRTRLAQRILYHHDEADTSSSNGPSKTPHARCNPVDLEEAERLKTRGNSFMQHKDFQAALECYTSALKLSPRGPLSHVYFSNRAAALVSMRQFHEAILDSERALALKPEYGKAHARLGLAQFLLGNYRPAMEAYTVALRYEPDNASSRAYLEKAAKRLAETDEAEIKAPASFSVVSQRGQESYVSLRHQETQDRQQLTNDREAEKYKAKGNSLMANRDYVEALDAYSQAIDLSPDGPQTHVYYSNRAAALCYLERYEDAQKDSINALKLDPTYAKAHARLGLSRFFLRDYAGAVDAYTSSLGYDPDNAASKSYLQKAQTKLAESQTPEGVTRQMMQQDPILADKVRRASQDPRELYNDPELRQMANEALADPAYAAALGRK